jgi:drug/metabolite transporter (DMT)-like permease
MIVGLGVFLCGLAYLLFQKDPAAQVNSAMPVLGLILLGSVLWFVGTVMQVISWADPKGSLAIGAIVLTVSLCITTAIAGVLIFGEKFTNTQMIGMALAVAGTALLSV